ncbi:hypothetical protein [Georgenia wangjunii]|uniref:hypothetical protein n=1 Tax=Georgenia wangjunii TaxID=3117730 RepID=UPI002F26C59F
MTTRSRPSIDALPTAFARARGEAADREWAELVIGRFYLDRINPALVTDELTRVLELVRESGEGPEELFGEAVEYVGTQMEQWRADGAPLAPPEPSTSWWDVPGPAACMASLLVVMLMVLEVVSGNWTTDYSLGKLLLPTLTSITAFVSITTFETLLMRTRRLWAIAGALVPAVAGGSALLAAIILGNDRPLFTGSVWWYVALVAVHALVTVAIVRFLPGGDEIRARRQTETIEAHGTITAADGTTTSAGTVASDDEWAAQLAGILRLRIEMPENDVRSTIAEARGHAATNGTSMAEEFGSPGAYASRLPRSTSGRRARERWRRAGWVAAVPILGYLAFEGLQHGWEWGNVRWIMAIAFVASCFSVAGFLRAPARER